SHAIPRRHSQPHPPGGRILTSATNDHPILIVDQPQIPGRRLTRLNSAFGLSRNVGRRHPVFKRRLVGGITYGGCNGHHGKPPKPSASSSSKPNSLTHSSVDSPFNPALFSNGSSGTASGRARSA